MHGLPNINDSMSIVIEARELTKTFRSYKKQIGFWGGVKGLVRREYENVHAASAVSFAMKEGELVGFLGPNGAGKTTVLKMLSGLLYPTSGSARVLGFIPWERKDEYRRQFSLVMGQKNQLWWDLPARESFDLNREIYSIDRKKFQSKLDELVTLLDVSDKLGVMVRELSLGERMKMELIAALLHSPRVLFLDEPTIGLDVVSAKKVREFLRVYNRDHKVTIILTSHYMADIEELCERVVIIDHGTIFFDGKLADIVNKWATHKVLRLVFDKLPADEKFLDMGECIERRDSMVQLKVPREKVAQVCRDLFARYTIHDINIEDLPVEEIIRSIFSKEREKQTGSRI
jgi:ABC-2 type transport system ATP-binding protein